MAWLSKIWLTIINMIYWICLFTAMFSLILSIAGFKKAGRWIVLSIILYIFIQSIKGL